MCSVQVDRIMGGEIHTGSFLFGVESLVSALFLETIMALFSCSKDTNITMFQEPSLRKEGTNL